MHYRPVGSINAARDYHIGQVIIGNQKEPATRKHLIILTPDVVFRQCFEQIQRSCTDAAIFFDEFVTNLRNHMAVQAAICWIILRTINPPIAVCMDRKLIHFFLLFGQGLIMFHGALFQCEKYAGTAETKNGITPQ